MTIVYGAPGGSTGVRTETEVDMRINRSASVRGAIALGALTLTVMVHGFAAAGTVAPLVGPSPAGPLANAVRLQTPSRATPPPPAGLPASTVAQFAQEALRQINAARSARWLPALTVDARLVAAAQSHADDQARRGQMSHVGGDGSTVGMRVSSAGYAWKSVAENVAYGPATPLDAMSAWMSSDGHRGNILSANTQVGIGVAVGADGRLYWTQVFATPG